MSALVRYPAYVSASRKTELTVRRFELLAVDERNCILVMMTSDSKVKSQLLRMQERRWASISSLTYSR